MARRAAKSEWQVRAEEARRNAQAVQSAWDGAAKLLPSMIPQAMDAFQDAAVAEDAERTQRNWSNILEYIDRERGMAQAKVEGLRRPERHYVLHGHLGLGERDLQALNLVLGVGGEKLQDAVALVGPQPDRVAP